MKNPGTFDYLRRAAAETRRHLALACISPRAFGIFALIRAAQLCGGHYQKLMPEKYAGRRQEKVQAGQILGWVEEARIYKILVGPLTLARFTITDPVALHILNFYYLRPASFIIKDLAALSRKGASIDLHERMHVFEPGCNMGRMLFLFRDFYKARITGADIYEDAINIVRKIKSAGDEFRAENILQSGWLASLPDNHFDLTIASSFINHVAHLDGYDAFLQQLLRTSRQLYIHDRALDNPACLDSLRASANITTLERSTELVLFARKKEAV